LPAQRLHQGVGAHVGIAVAVAANPLAHAQKAGHAALAQGLFKFGVDFGNFAQEGGFVIRQRVLDLVRHRQLAVAQQPRLPELRDAGAQLRLVARQFAGREGVAGAVVELGALGQVAALGQQLGNGALGVQNAFALHLGGVGGEHGRDIAAGQGLRHGAGRNAGPAQARQGDVDAALLRVARALADGAAANVVAVFGQVGQV